jgi:hypothetical protein
MWNKDVIRSSWVVLVLGAWSCSAPAPNDGVSRQAVTQEPAVVGHEIATDPPVLQAADVGHNPVVASDGNGFLAVQEVSSRIRAVRVGPTGAVLDSPWIDLGEATADQYYPSVVFGGGHYLVTWSAFLDDGGSTIEGRFVKPNGDVEGSANFTLASSATYPSVGWNGTRFLLSYLSLTGTDANNVAITAFNADGTGVPNSTHSVSAPGSIAYPRLAVGATASLVAWEAYVHDDVLGDVGSIRGALVDASGAPASAGELALSAPGAASVNVAAGDAGFLAVWHTTDSPSAVKGSVVSASGAVTSPGVAISHSSQDSGLPSVAFDGDSYLVAWADGRDEQSVYGNRVSATGVVSSPTDVKLATGSPRYVAFGSDRTNLAWSGSEFLLTFLGHGIEGSLIASDLSLVNGQIPLTGVPNKQGYPLSVWTGQNYLVVWTDERNSYTDMEVRGVRIGGDATLLDPQGISLSDPENPAFSAQLASTRQGSAVVVWFGSTGASFSRTIASDGTLGVSQPFQTEPLYSPAALASNGTGYLAAYATGDSSNGAVLGRLLDVNGTSGPAFALDSSTVNTSPVAFAVGDGYLVSYSKSGTWLLPVSGSGVHGESVLLSSGSVYATVASSGAGPALVVWPDAYDTGTGIHGRFFVAGALSGPTLEIAETSAGYGAAVAWDGTNYWAVWETPEHLLQARAIGTDGALGPVSIWVEQECFAPVLSSDGQGQLLLSYTKYGEQSQTRRVFSRLVGRGAVSSDGGAGGAAGAGGGGASAGSSGTGIGGTGGSSSGGSSSAGSTSTGGSSSNAGASGSGSSPPPSPRCSLNVPGASNGHRGFIGVGLGLFAAALLRRRRWM